jgi:hypothetical protein
MRWAGHMARTGEGRGVHGVLVGRPEGKNHWGDQDVDGRIILKWFLRKWEGYCTVCVDITIGCIPHSSHITSAQRLKHDFHITKVSISLFYKV